MPHHSNTRRRAATELVKGLRKHYEETVSGIFTAYINLLLQQYAANPAENWRAKDAAMYLVTALSVTTATAKAGANRTNEVRFRVCDDRFRVFDTISRCFSAVFRVFDHVFYVVFRLFFVFFSL